MTPALYIFALEPGRVVIVTPHIWRVKAPVMNLAICQLNLHGLMIWRQKFTGVLPLHFLILMFCCCMAHYVITVYVVNSIDISIFAVILALIGRFFNDRI